MSKGEHDTATRHYREAVRLHPDYAEAHGNLGTALLSTGRTAQALRHLSRAVDINADSGPARYNLGVALAMMGQSEEALAQLREATRLQPDWPAPLHRTAWILSTDRKAKVRDGGVAGAVALYGQIRRIGLQLKDSSDVYQENWRLAIADVLSNRSADYDYLELI